MLGNTIIVDAPSVKKNLCHSLPNCRIVLTLPKLQNGVSIPNHGTALTLPQLQNNVSISNYGTVLTLPQLQNVQNGVDPSQIAEWYHNPQL